MPLELVWIPAVMILALATLIHALLQSDGPWPPRIQAAAKNRDFGRQPSGGRRGRVHDQP